ncbi:hypothetical protein HHI36_003684 [Cryptolaemus montrouzieri]|uniref:mRNA-decapping enzyme 2 n=1 Tax=Cryptolaemus montrouzieri TaxID=559131 RepID=A0ABD2PE53_9CUCU
MEGVAKYVVPARRRSQKVSTIPSLLIFRLITQFVNPSLISTPELAKRNMRALLFQIELAYWNYLDHHVAKSPSLPSCRMEEFAKTMFMAIPSVCEEIGNLPEFLREWRKFKLTIPTYGAIFISPDDSHVLMVQGYSGNWSFPRGKMESGENPEECAVREVLEEVGFDISHLIKSDEYMENKTEERYSRLYIIKDISIDTIFKTQTISEIKEIRWFSIRDLPATMNDHRSSAVLGIKSNKFFLCHPFIGNLKKMLLPKTWR